MKGMKKRVVALLLALLMLCDIPTMSISTVYAADTNTTNMTKEESDGLIEEPNISKEELEGLTEEPTIPKEDITEETSEETLEEITEEIVVSALSDSELDEWGLSDDELFQSYIDRQFYGVDLGISSLAIYKPAGNALSGDNKAIYDSLVPQIKKVAAEGGATDSFKVIINSYTPGQSYNIRPVMNALLADMPYDLYWFDKTSGMRMGISSNGVSTTYTIGMAVSAAYRDNGNQYKVTAEVSKIEKAAGEAKRVAALYKDYSQNEKLERFKKYICDEVSYNNDAANNRATPYGDPWQLIYVFDKDSTTKVVCEGYAKAFKYLCDMTGEACYLATGMMISSSAGGPHMWNIVTLDDGINYLVDVTNCDGNSVGAPDKLFLKNHTNSATRAFDVNYSDGTKGSVTLSGYEFTVSFGKIGYYYDEDMESILGKDILTLGPIYKNSSIVYELNGGTNSPDNPVSYYEGRQVVFKDPTRVGYTFEGWYDNQSFSGDRILHTGTGDLHLYAKWRPNEYKVSFISGYYGAQTIPDITVYYDSTYNTLPTPQRDGYTFNGWYTSQTGETMVTSATTVELSSDQTLYALWSANTYIVTLDGGKKSDGTEVILDESSITVLYDDRYTGLPTANRDDAKFLGWYTASVGGEQVTENTYVVIVGDHTLYARWEEYDYGDVTEEDIASGSEEISSPKDIPNHVWVSGINPEGYEYTGKAITIPNIKVFWGNTLLKKDTDYTISYKNNTKAWENNPSYDSAKAPTITIKGKGNYNESEVISFEIHPLNILDEECIVDEVIAVAYNKSKQQKLVPTVTYAGKKLKYSAKGTADYKVEYDDETKPGSYKEPGEYDITIKGTGNYTGAKTIREIITADKLISKATIKIVPNQDLKYTGEAIEPQFTVMMGKEKLNEGIDYEISWKDNTEVGTATAVFTGIEPKYAGTKRITFKITGENLSKATANRISNKIYTGKEIELTDGELASLGLMINGRIVGRDEYEPSYSKNVNPGTATLILTGKGRYAGSSKKISFKIDKYPLSSRDIDNVAKEVVYTKAGAKAAVTVKRGDEILKEGVHYKLSYKNNNSVQKEATVTITGIGGYSGSVVRTYKIAPRDMSINDKPDEKIEVVAADKLYQNKKNIYKTTITVTDGGKKLGSGDYDTKNIEYSYASSDSPIPSDKVLSHGTKIKVTIKAKPGSNYYGEAVGYYRITNLSMSKVSISGKISKQYTGKEVELLESDFDNLKLIYKIDNKTTKVLEYGKDYKIVPGSYVSNIKKGTAKVTIRGEGEFGGTKVISFTINAKPLR